MPLLLCFHCYGNIKFIMRKVKAGLYCYLTAGILTECFYKCLLSNPPPSIKKFYKFLSMPPISNGANWFRVVRLSMQQSVRQKPCILEFWNFIYGFLMEKYLTHVFLSLSELLAHLSQRLTRWAYRMGLEPASVRASVRASTLSNMNISETSRPITTKFYLKHHWGGGKAALGFDADQIRTLVSMATDSSHRVIMGKRASSRFLDCFWSDPFCTCR